MSSYLFILCIEGLFALIKEFEMKGLLHGYKIARYVPSISHLFFADYAFFFFRANRGEREVMKNCFSVYEKASGQ